MRITLRTLAGLAIAAVIAAAGFVYSGIYDVSALDQHLAPTYHVLDFAMKRAVKVRAGGIVAPPLDDPALIDRGRARFQEHCAQCHGAPGVAPQPFALGLTPAPSNLAYTGAEWTESEIYWTVRYGLKMTGMPAWEFRLPDDELWAVVAFVKRLPALSPEAYRALGVAPVAKMDSTGDAPDSERGRFAIQQYACVTCHTIPGIVGANAPVGPPLAKFALRRFIAGHLQNTPENVAAFLQAPQQVKPGGAMPDLQVSERDARDMAAWLATLR